MSWLRIGIYTGISIVVLLIAFVVVLLSVDLGRFKGQIEVFTSELLEREFRVDGDFHLFLGSSLELFAEDIYLANPEWAEDKAFATAHKIHIIVDTMSLLKGPIDINLLEIDGIRIHLEENGEGSASWEFTGLEAEQPANNNTEPVTLLPLIIGSLNVTDTEVSYNSPTRTEALVFTSDTLLSSINANDFIIQLNGSLNGTPLYLENKIGPVENLFAYKNVTMDFTGNIGELVINGSSIIDDLLAPVRPTLELNFEGPNARYLTDLLSLEPITSGPLQFSILLEEDDRQMSTQLSGIFGEFNLNMDARFRDVQNFSDLEITLAAGGPDIGTISRALGVDGVTPDDFRISAAIGFDSSGYLIRHFELVIDDDVFQFNGHIGEDLLTGDSNFEFDLAGTDLGSRIIIALEGSVNNLPKGSYHLRGKVEKEGDKLWLRAINAEIGNETEYQLQLSGFLNTDQQFAGSEISIHAQGASLSTLAELAGQEGIPNYPFNVAVDIRRGATNTYIENGLFEVSSIVMGFTGVIGDSPTEDDMALTFNIKVPEPAAVLADNGIVIAMLPEGELHLSGAIEQTAGNIAIEQLELSLAGATLAVDADLASFPLLTGSRFDFDLEGDDLSRLLPAQLRADTLIQPYRASGRVLYGENDIIVEGLLATLGQTTFGGDIGFSLAPLLGSGQFTVQAGSPDIFQLFPRVRELSPDAQVARMSYRSSGNWEENYWYFENSRLELGEAYLEIKGSLEGLPTFERTDLDITWVSSSVRRLSVLVGRELPDQALFLKGHLEGSRDVMSMNDFEFTLGESDLQGEMTIRAGDIPSIDIEIKSKLFDISEYLPELEEETASEPNTDARVIPDFTVPIELLTLFEADVDIQIDEMRNGILDMLDFQLNAEVADGALILQNFSYIGERGGDLTISGELSPDESGGTKYSLIVDGHDDVLAFRAISEEEILDLPLFEIHANLSTKGETVRDIAGSLDGYLRVIGGPGRTSTRSLGLFTQDIVSQLIATINPFATTENYTNVNCTAIMLNFENGIVDGDPAFVQETDKLQISAKSVIDLRTETIQADFKTVASEGLGLSFSSLINPYVQLTGTLGEPSLVLNPEGVLIEGGLAVATAGLSILALSFRDRIFYDQDPCANALAEADLRYESRDQ